MMITANIHPSLMRFTDNKKKIELSVDTASDLISALCEHCPNLKSRILTADGELTPYVNIYINGIHLTRCVPSMPLDHKDQVDLVTALVGG